MCVRNKFRAFREYFSEYAGNSTIHGVRYLGERGRPFIEKMWWFAIFGLSLYGCGKLIAQIYVKWDNAPVIVTFGEQPTPVWDIPFPAITICPDIKARGDVFNFTKVYLATREPNFDLDELHPNDVRYLETMSQLCLQNLDVAAAVANVTDNLTEQELIKSFRELAPPQSHVLLFCQFRNEKIPCNKLFSEIVTEIGICYTFNLLDSNDLFRPNAVLEYQRKSGSTKRVKDWGIDSGYSSKANRDSYPFRATQTGLEGNLEMFMGIRINDIDYTCRGPTPGFRVHLHSPCTMPQMTKKFILTALEQNVFIELQPMLMKTSDGLKNYEPVRRQCYYSHERYLRFFHIYTAENCELECLSNYTRAKCNCVKFSMPHSVHDQVCGSDETHCYNGATFQFEEMIFQGNENAFLRQCNCLPGCTSLKYRTLISQSKLEPQASLNFIKQLVTDDTKPMNGSSTYVSRLRITFNDFDLLSSVRSERYGLTDFIANVGGLLGLFMGFSLLSVFEIIYFFTIRVMALTVVLNGISFMRLEASRRRILCLNLCQHRSKMKTYRKLRKKAHKSRPKLLFANYIYRLMRNINEDLSISTKTMTIMDNMCMDLFYRWANEASALIKITNRQTIKARDILAATHLLLQGKLKTHALHQARKALRKYRSSFGH